jgi:hypothetical protein
MRPWRVKVDDHIMDIFKINFLLKDIRRVIFFQFLKITTMMKIIKEMKPDMMIISKFIKIWAYSSMICGIKEFYRDQMDKQRV